MASENLPFDFDRAESELNADADQLSSALPVGSQEFRKRLQLSEFHFDIAIIRSKIGRLGMLDTVQRHKWERVDYEEELLTFPYKTVKHTSTPTSIRITYNRRSEDQETVEVDVEDYVIDFSISEIGMNMETARYSYGDKRKPTLPPVIYTENDIPKLMQGGDYRRPNPTYKSPDGLTLSELEEKRWMAKRVENLLSAVGTDDIYLAQKVRLEDYS